MSEKKKGSERASDDSGGPAAGSNWRLNARAARVASKLLDDPARYRIDVSRLPSGARVIDCGVRVTGGLEAGTAMAEVCLAGLGHVRLTSGAVPGLAGPAVQVATDQPVAACMASQYAGWQLKAGKFFAMGSGPMRAAYGGERLFEEIGCREKADLVVGVLESSDLPTDEAAEKVAVDCRVRTDRVTLLVARTASLAGAVQVVARSVETALHKMHTIGFDLGQVASGFGTAPLPPIAADDLTAIGLTNDAVLYGGSTTLWVTGDDEPIERLGPQIPSSSSADFGQPFLAIFDRYERDFYKIDPLLFSPAQVTLVNLTTGNTFRFGELRDDILQQSFHG